jgi:hypothetical protein
VSLTAAGPRASNILCQPQVNDLGYNDVATSWIAEVGALGYNRAGSLMFRPARLSIAHPGVRSVAHWLATGESFDLADLWPVTQSDNTAFAAGESHLHTF